MTTPTVAVGAFVFDPEGRILVVERGNPPGEGLWSVPGGKLEEGETLVQAVAREVREETGLVVEVGTLACVVERIGDGYHYVILDYLARVIGRERDAEPGMDASGFIPRAGGDARNARFVSETELFKLPLTEGLQLLIDRARTANKAWR